MTAKVREEPIMTNLNAVTIEDPLTYNAEKPEEMNPEEGSTPEPLKHEAEEVQLPQDSQSLAYYDPEIERTFRQRLRNCSQPQQSDKEDMAEQPRNREPNENNINKSKLDVTQTKLVFKNKEGFGDNSQSYSSLSYKMFTIESAHRLLAEMIIIDELPFKFVDNQGFRRFVDGTLTLVEPNFVLPSRKTIAKDILGIYDITKEMLKGIFVKKGYRVSLTTDTWPSIQNMNYLVLTAHFIDKDWKLHKRILNFTQIENHRGETIGKEVEKCLKQWGIENVMTLTVDNASSNDTVIAYLKKRFKHGLVLDGEFLHVRCCAHILNLIVCDSLKYINDSLDRIRDAVRFVRYSPTRLVTFKKCITEENIDSKSMLCLDVPTRWNSTYLMLKAAVKFEKAFERLEDYDTVYMNEEEKPTTRDWEMVRIFTKFLSVFYEVTVRLSESLYVTSNTIFHEISIFQNCIKKYSSATIPNDVLLQEMAMKMQEKFDKYWEKRDRTNLFLYIAFVLDPHYKMKFLLNCLNQLFDVYVAKGLRSKIEGVLRALFNEYNLSLSVANKGQSSCTIKSSLFRTLSASASEIFRFDFEDLDEDDSQSVDSEVYIYLLEPRVKREDDFDILDWWKGNSSRYKILSKIARDLLAVPVSTVASESAFSTSGKVIDPFRTSLSPTTVERYLGEVQAATRLPADGDLYQGLNPASQTAANAAAAGGLLDKTYEEAKSILYRISKNHEDWQESDQRLRIKDNDSNDGAIASFQNQMAAMMSLIQGELKNRPQEALSSSTELPRNAGAIGNEQCLAVSLLSEKMTVEVREEPITTNLNAVTTEDPLTYNVEKPEEMNPEVASTPDPLKHEAEEVQLPSGPQGLKEKQNDEDKIAIAAATKNVMIPPKMCDS
ncbi:zinc finger BED domain-containing protein RICESLEEPER 2-like [Benincasa hispida]|uniref:zinc finger BED domain-containing protein RICESLEEPER 2-like n=1 Tax=Benincasa hispida TaxID=102211 RepID=UPI0019008ED6|nr:zinc finger BED domain-containing protein RICESLEEPER 2-like [Benincasa hispida]